MEQPLKSAAPADTPEKKPVLGIVSLGVGLIWIVLLTLLFTGSIDIPRWLDDEILIYAGFACGLVGLCLGIADIIRTRRGIYFSITGVVANSIVIGFLYWFVLLRLFLAG